MQSLATDRAFQLSVVFWTFATQTPQPALKLNQKFVEEFYQSFNRDEIDLT